jgi:hypothetical protein
MNLQYLERKAVISLNVFIYNTLNAMIIISILSLGLIFSISYEKISLIIGLYFAGSCFGLFVYTVKLFFNYLLFIGNDENEF